MKAIWKQIWSCVWRFSEFFYVPLGRFAPWVFSQMIGAKGKKIADTGITNAYCCECGCYFYDPNGKPRGSVNCPQCEYNEEKTQKDNPM